jgi:hypothetical protein
MSATCTTHFLPTSVTSTTQHLEYSQSLWISALRSFKLIPHLDPSCRSGKRSARLEPIAYSSGGDPTNKLEQPHPEANSAEAPLSSQLLCAKGSSLIFGW